MERPHQSTSSARLRCGLVTVLLALLGALFIGISDFLGAAASRTASALTVSAVLQLVGLIVLAPIAAVLGASALSAGAVGLGAVSGLITSVAIFGFFTVLAHGRIGVVLPVSAAVSAFLPALAGVVGGNRLSGLALGGIACALAAIPLVAYEPEEGEDAPAGESWPVSRQVTLAGACGVGFGAYLICIGHTTTASGLWPTVANLAVAAAVTVPVAMRAGEMPGPLATPRLALLGGVAVGLADTTLTTALQRGPLAVASVLAVLGERVHPWHALGIALALVGVSMIAAG
jgi:drug/metabolite transporter (DMT)-like permease